MTTVIIYHNSNQEYTGFTCMGHAGYAKKSIFGTKPDILCAAISTLTINTVNSLETLAAEKDNMKIDTNEATGFIKCEFLHPITNPNSKILLDAMVLGLTELSNEYGNKYLQVKFEEV